MRKVTIVVILSPTSWICHQHHQSQCSGYIVALDMKVTDKIIDVTEPFIRGRTVVLWKPWTLTIKLNPNTVYCPWIMVQFKLSWLTDLSADQKLNFTAACGSRKNGILDLQVNSLWNWIWLWRLRLRRRGFSILTFEIPSSYNCNNLLYLFNHQIPQIIPSFEQSLTHHAWLIHDSFFSNFGIIEFQFRYFLYGYLLKWSFVKTEVFSSRKILQKARWVTSSVWLIPY